MAIARRQKRTATTDKMEMLSDRLLELSFVVEEVIYGPSRVPAAPRSWRSRPPISEPEAFFHPRNAIIDPYDTSPGAATLMHVAPIDRPIKFRSRGPRC